MPFEGISFNDAGFKIVTPSEMNIQTELSSQAQAKIFVKKLDEAQKISPDGKNKKNNNSQNSKNKPEDPKKESEEYFEENLDENPKTLAGKSGKLKKYKVYFNPAKDVIEFIDRETGSVIETISPDELVNLIAKSKTVSGILVDRRI